MNCAGQSVVWRIRTEPRYDIPVAKEFVSLAGAVDRLAVRC